MRKLIVYISLIYLSACSQSSKTDQNPKIINHKPETAFSQWKGDLEQVDDVCIIGIRI